MAPNIHIADERARLTRGYLLGTLGVVIFAMTLPMTRLAVGDSSHPQLPPAFVTAGRAAVAGLLSLLVLLVLRAPRPARVQWLPLAVSALGTWATHLPGSSAVTRPQRPSLGFWACAVLGCMLVLVFAAWQGSGRLNGADGWLLFAVLSAALGYVAGARAAMAMPAQQVICWVLVGSLPFTLPAMLWWWPAAPVRASAWLGFGYAAVFSMWLGFFAWYRGLALGGVVRVSQVQLLQPFLALLFAVPVLGEPLDGVTLLFALAVIAVVFVGKRMPVRQGLG